jgi:hypothetical protein
MAIDATQKNVIDYCGTWYGSNCGSLMAMFVDPKHILYGSNAILMVKRSLILV